MSRSPACPFCRSEAVQRVGQWGGQMITAQWRCETCGSYFEAIREDFDEPDGDQAAERSASPPSSAAK